MVWNDKYCSPGQGSTTLGNTSHVGAARVQAVNAWLTPYITSPEEDTETAGSPGYMPRIQNTLPPKMSTTT